MPANPGDGSTPELDLRVITHEDATVVVCSGWLTREFTAKFKKDVKSLFPGSKRIVLDLARVTYMDSSGIGALVKCFSKLKKSGGALRLAGVKGMVEGVLKLTRVNTVIGTYPTADAASEDFPPANQS